MSAPTPALTRELAAIVGAEHVLLDDLARFSHDATESHGLSGRADAAVLPGSAEEVAAVLGWCYGHDVPIVPRGGGTGFAGGAVPIDGGVVIGLERLRGVRELSPLLWRAHVEAGLTTAHVHRLARENGLFFAPDPGAAEDSQIGGNVATNAGGPHAFKYGVTGAWVTGLEVAVAPGELISVGGAVRKDVAGYDLRGLMIGSEGTLGIVTAVWLKLLPAPEARFPVAACYAHARAGCEAIETVLGSGIVPSAIEFLDRGALAAAGGAFPVELGEPGFMVIAEADGEHAEAGRVREELLEVLSEGATAVHAPERPGEIEELWRWREGVSLAVAARRGGKMSEDIGVPLDRLAEAVEATVEIGARHGLAACSWGHAGDGNVHATFMIERSSADELARATLAAGELFELAVRLGGTISGEHGIGVVKRGALAGQWSERALALHAAVKHAFDPKGLLNPGKKQPLAPGAPPVAAR